MFVTGYWWHLEPIKDDGIIELVGGLFIYASFYTIRFYLFITEKFTTGIDDDFDIEALGLIVVVDIVGEPASGSRC